MKKSILPDHIINDYNALKSHGLDLPAVIIQNHKNDIGILTNPDIWPAIIDSADIEQQAIDIVTPRQQDWKPNILELYSDAVRKQIQFPPNTCFLHGMGCLSSAISRHFRFKPYPGGDKELPVNLFCVSGQPPSTGKTGVDEAFLNPIKYAYQALNKKNGMERVKIQANIDDLRKTLKNTTGPAQSVGTEEEIFNLKEKMNKIPIYKLSVDDPTPEGLEKLAISQNGWVNIVSSEMEAINVMLGNVYGDAGRSANNGIFLKMWGGEWMSSIRASRESYEGPVMGTCAVLAQPEVVEKILEAGKGGRGISERFLMINETELLGMRDMHQYTPVPSHLKVGYHKMINNLVSDEGVCFEFDADAHYQLNEYRNVIESKMKSDGEYGDNMIRGYVGKAGSQVQRIACILWAAKEWAEDGSKSKRIGVKTIMRAIGIFDELSKTYLAAAEDYGCAGLQPKLEAVKKYLCKKVIENAKVKKVTFVSASQLQQSLKKNSQFKTITGLTNYLVSTIMPELERQKVVIHSRGYYYVNQRIIEIEVE